MLDEKDLLTFKGMNHHYAKEISVWTYPEPFSLYSMDGSEQTVREFLEENYYYAQNWQGELIGYICYGQSSRVPEGYVSGIYNDDTYIDVGLGIRPDLTGQGLGYQFFCAGLRFLERLLHTDKFRLVVATFNERAIKVYERAGFIQDKMFLSTVNHNEVEFVCMIKQ